MASSVTDIANLALAHLGEAPIESLNEDTKAARAANLHYADTRNALLREHRWNFAIARAALSRLSTTPPFGHAYEYGLPDDCLRVLEFNDTEAGDWLTTEFKVEGKKLLTDADTVNIVYVRKVEDVTQYDSLFVKALAMKLAIVLSESIRGTTQKTSELEERYNRLIGPIARRVDGNEGRRRKGVLYTSSPFVRSREAPFGDGLGGGVGAGTTPALSALWGNITGTLANQTDLINALNAKQAALVSGTNIKTVNGTSLLGSGNIVISGGSSAWADITGKPTTLSGFGITDGITAATAAATYQPIGDYLTTVAWDDITGKPSTFAPSAHTHAWSDITSGVPSFIEASAIGVDVQGYNANTTTLGNTTTGTGAIVLGDSPTLTAPTLGVASATSLAVTGTSGGGFAGFVAQASAPAAPVGGLRLYSDSVGRLAWRRASDGFTRTFDSTLTANRAWTMPDSNTTVPIFSQLITFTGPTTARTVTLPDANVTLARTDGASFTGGLTLQGNLNLGNDFIRITPNMSNGISIGWGSSINGVAQFHNYAVTGGGTLAMTPNTPAQITSDQNNYNPGGASMFQRWSSNASRTVTGMTFGSTAISGQQHIICNVGTNDIVLAHENASSTAANRFACTTGANITLSANQEATCWYDNTASRWRVSKRN